jgi:two-component system NtrC family sensor kinase
MNLTRFTEIDWRIRVFDSLSFPTLILRPDRTIVSANRKFLERFDTTEETVVGLTCREFFRTFAHDQHLPCLKASCPLDKALQDAKGHSVLREIPTPNGRSRWEDRVFSPILDEQGRVIYIIESVRDVTRTKRLEQMIHGIRELLERIIESSASAIMAADRDGRVLLMNPAAEELFDYDFKNVGRLDVKALYPPGTAREIMKMLRDDSCGGRGKLPPTQVTICTAGGEAVPVEMTGAIIFEGDQEFATMGIYNDLRERMAVEDKLREAEAQIMQAEKMASLGRLAAGVAHEINNPLTGILMYGNILLEKSAKDDPMRTNLEYVLEDAGRCKDIVRGLLDYSRQASAAREFFSLNTLLEESLRLIRDQKLFAKIRIDWDLSSIPIHIMADRNKMRQVIINLVINAIDAMRRQGVLSLRTYADKGKKTACIEVGDTGCGIDEKNRTRIFDPFFTTKQPGQGTGLGLSTAYGIVKNNGGEIHIKRTGSQGTVFLLKLPLAESHVTGMPESIG